MNERETERPARAPSDQVEARLEERRAGLDELAAAVVLVDAAAPESITAVEQAIASLVSLYESASDARRLLAAMRAAWHAAATPGEKEAAAGSLSDAIEQLRELTRREARHDGDAAPTEDAHWDNDTIEIVADFLAEAFESLANVDETLIAADGGPVVGEDVNAVFRAFHTIKGIANFLELADISELAHVTENLLNAVRDGQVSLRGVHLDHVLEATRLMRLLLEEVRSAVEGARRVRPHPAVPSLVERLAAELAMIGAGGEDTASSAMVASPELAPTERPERHGPPAAASSAPAPDASPATTSRGGKLRDTIKVDVERVDTLVEMIGELLIVESLVLNSPEMAALSSLRLRNSLGQLSKISRDLQHLAMRMRTVPVRSLFQRMVRLGREISRKVDKPVVIEYAGETTEMDRGMVERLEEPLVHMIRNAIDHGIESRADRQAAGKPTVGSIRLSAYHEGGSIVIELADDGRGLVRDKLVRRAVERQLIRDPEGMTDGEVYSLIFEPGFSTATEVTQLSGRGVGMDVVKRNLEAMRGRITVGSAPGRGTTFKLVLPLTLAIIDGMLVTAGAERYIVPSLAIVESFRPEPHMLHAMASGEEIIHVRGEVLPCTRLRRLLDADAGAPEQSHATGIAVVVESMGRKLALLVDDILSQQQVVIKPLGTAIDGADQGQERFSGGAILPDGQVGLILNVDRLCSRMTRHRYVGEPRRAAAH